MSRNPATWAPEVRDVFNAAIDRSASNGSVVTADHLAAALANLDPWTQRLLEALGIRPDQAGRQIHDRLVAAASNGDPATRTATPPPATATPPPANSPPDPGSSRPRR